MDLPETRFWITSGWPTIRPLAIRGHVSRDCTRIIWCKAPQHDDDVSAARDHTVCNATPASLSHARGNPTVGHESLLVRR